MVETPAHRSKKLIVCLTALGVLALLGGVALQTGADAGLYAAVSAPITTLALGFVGGVAWMDRGVRVATVEAHSRVAMQENLRRSSTASQVAGGQTDGIP